MVFDNIFGTRRPRLPVTCHDCGNKAKELYIINAVYLCLRCALKAQAHIESRK